MITLKAYFKGRDVEFSHELTGEILDNAARTVAKVNALLNRADLGDVEMVNSGWRPSAVNDQTANSASHSSHLTAEACDVFDPDGALDKWCLAHIADLVDLGLWVEHPGWTDGWCHLQTRPPGWPPNPDGPRIYIPSTKPPMTTIYGTMPVYA